ncbi:MAG: hypothetical protein ACK587_08260 [Cyanobacteriota bacterium]
MLAILWFQSAPLALLVVCSPVACPIPQRIPSPPLAARLRAARSSR